MSDSENKNYSEAGTTDWRPGARLRDVREEAKVSLDKIAKETLIPLNKLQFLEDDEYARVGKEIFVIGYIRKYAKSLGIASDPLVAQFKLVTGFRDSTDIGSNTLQMTHIRPDATFSFFDKIKGWQIVGLILIIWLLSVYVLKSREEEVALEPALSSEQREVDALRQIPQIEESTFETTDLDTLDEHMEDEETPEVPAVIEAEAAESSSEATESLSVSVGVGRDTLVMRFSDECWVRVRDAKGEVIFAQLQNSGDNLRLSGEGPFRVVLGNVRAVEMLFNDRRVNAEPVEGQRHLNLKVGP